VSNSVIETIESFQVKKDSYYSKGGSLFFTAEALVDELVPLEVIKEYAWTFKGKELRWIHELPELNIDNLIGHIHDAYVENDKLSMLVELWGYKDDLKEKQEMVKNGELSISAGFKKTERKKGEIVAIYGRELSLTPTPVCTPEMGCGISSIVMNTKKNEKVVIMGENFKEIYEQFQKTVISQNDERGEKIVELDATVSAMEERIGESNTLIADLTEENETLQKENGELKISSELNITLSLRHEIVKMERITDEEAVKEELEKLSHFTKAELEDTKMRLERIVSLSEKEGRPAPLTGDVEEEEQIATEKLEKLSAEQVAARLNPELGAYIKNVSNRSNNPAPLGYDKGEGDVPFIN